METVDKSMSKRDWQEIAIFYILAVGISAPFRLGLIRMEVLISLPKGLNVFYSILKALGPILGFFVMFYVFKVKTYCIELIPFMEQVELSASWQLLLSLL